MKPIHVFIILLAIILFQIGIIGYDISHHSSYHSSSQHIITRTVILTPTPLPYQNKVYAPLRYWARLACQANAIAGNARYIADMPLYSKYSDRYWDSTVGYSKAQLKIESRYNIITPLWTDIIKTC